MAIGTTVGEASDIGRVGVHSYQGRGGQDAATKIGNTSLDLIGDLAVYRTEDSNS